MWGLTQGGGLIRNTETSWSDITTKFQNRFIYNHTQTTAHHYGTSVDLQKKLQEETEHEHLRHIWNRRCFISCDDSWSSVGGDCWSSVGGDCWSSISGDCWSSVCNQVHSSGGQGRNTLMPWKAISSCGQQDTTYILNQSMLPPKRSQTEQSQELRVCIVVGAVAMSTWKANGDSLIKLHL